MGYKAYRQPAWETFTRPLISMPSSEYTRGDGEGQEFMAGSGSDRPACRPSQTVCMMGCGTDGEGRKSQCFHALIMWLERSCAPRTCAPLALASAAAAAAESMGRRANSQSPPRYCSVSGSKASNVEQEVPDRATFVGAPPLTTAQSYLSVAFEELPVSHV